MFLFLITTRDLRKISGAVGDQEKEDVMQR